MCRPNDSLPCTGRRIPEPESGNVRAPSMAADFASNVDVPGSTDQGIRQRFGHEAQREWGARHLRYDGPAPPGRIPFISVAEHRLIRIEGAHSMQTNAARVRRPRRGSRRTIATIAACLATVLTVGVVVVAPANGMPSRPSLTAAVLPLTMSIGGSGLYTESFTLGLSGVAGRQVVVRYAGRTWNARLNPAGKASATLPVNNGLRAGSYQISGTYMGTTKAAVIKTLTIRSNTKTSLSLDRSSQAFLGTPANVSLQVRGFDGATPPAGTFIVYRNNKPFARRVTNSDGRTSIPVPANLGVGMQSFTVRFLPRDNHYLTSTAGSSLLSVTKGTTSATMSLSSRVVVDHRARMTLQVRAARGPATGNVTIKSGSGTLAVRRLDSRGMSYLDLPAYSSGTYTITVVFAGNGALKGSSVQRKMAIVRAAPKISVSAKASGSSVRISSAVSGSYGSPTSRATVYLDGHAKTTVPASGGAVTVASLAAGRHIVNVQYPGDIRYQPAKAATAVTVTSTTNPCSPSARACVDLTHNLTWLQSNGRITYGPVSMLSGRPGYRTETGTFAVYWKDINHHSSIFDDAPMPYAIFFDGGTAFHEGSLYVESHGCVHLSSSTAQYYWSALDYGDVVQVFGYAPY